MTQTVKKRCFCNVLALGVAIACAITAASLAPGAEAAKTISPNATLLIHPGGGPARFGDTQTLEAQVSRPSGAGIDGAEVEFEVVGGPGDHDGNTPRTPDIACVTAGGDAHHASTCTATYTEPLNQSGSDGVLAWIDADGDDSTVEADLGEGENENAPGTGGCAPGTKGPGEAPEPDATDCVEKRWQGRVPSAVDLEPRASSGPLGSVVDFAATVRDQFGDPFGIVGGQHATISFELLAGSAHDPGDGSDFSSPDLGTCDTGLDGTCSVPFAATTGGTDIVCAYLAGASSACGQVADAAPAGPAAVVTRTWEAPPPPPAGQDAGTPTAPGAPAPPPEPAKEPDPTSTRGGRTEPPQDSGEPRDKPSPEAPQDSNGSPHDSGEPAPVGQPPAPRASGPQARSRAGHVHRRHHPPPHARIRRTRSGAATRHGAQARPAAPTFAPRQRNRRPEHHHRTSLDELSQAAFTTAHKLSFPIGLTLLVIAFLVIQGRFDRRDPKLRLAPIDSKHDLVPFT
jgi:hypothetical protein